MVTIPFLKKSITCVLAGFVLGAATLRLGVTYFLAWVPMRIIAPMTLLGVVVAIACILAWQAGKDDRSANLAFWQGLIRYGVAFDLAGFGWEKICHMQLVMPLNRLDLPYGSLPTSEIFWSFYSYSYLLGCVIAGFQIVGALLLLFRRTRLAGVFILLPVLGNILLMDIFYKIGDSVVVHASIMMAGVLYLLLMDFDRLKKFFFGPSDRSPAMRVAGIVKWTIRLSIVYVPLVLIALHGRADKFPQLTGKYEVRQLSAGEGRQVIAYPGSTIGNRQARQKPQDRIQSVILPSNRLLCLHQPFLCCAARSWVYCLCAFPASCMHRTRVSKAMILRLCG